MIAVADRNTKSSTPNSSTASDGRVWLKHPETGGVQSFAPEAADAWRGMGWVDTDPPEEPDPTLTDAAPDAEQVDADSNNTNDESSTTKPRRSTRRATSDSEEA